MTTRAPHSASKTKQHTHLNPPTQNDLYQRITDKIVADLEAGQLTWRKPWQAEHLNGQVGRPLRWNDVPYQGVNTLLLWGTAAEKGYQSPYWMTFKQALDLKACVRKGEKSTQIVYADKFTVEDKNNEGETVYNQIPFLKPYAVFNADQIEDLPPTFSQRPQPANSPLTRDERLDAFFANTRITIATGKDASYSLTADRVQMPPLASFTSVAAYYAVLAHEITHATRHPSRLNRDFGRRKYGDAGYAEEELVAELGACFLAADLGFEPMPEAQHAAYIQSWLHVLRNDKRFIFSAASHAQKAAEYLHTLQPA